MLQRDLVGVLERPELGGLHAGEPEQQEDGLLQPFVDDDLAVDDLGDPRVTGVEQVDGRVHHRPGLGLALPTTP